MRRIAVILDDGVVDRIYFEAAGSMKAIGHELVRLRTRNPKITRGRGRGRAVKVGALLKNVSADQFDGLWIPRGYKLEHLRKGKEIVNWVEKFLESGKPVWSPRLSSGGLTAAPEGMGREEG